MQFFTPIIALLAAVATAQNSTSGQYNAINIPQGGQLTIAAGGNTITWGMPSSGTVTIKLQECCGVTTPNDGVVLASGIPASAGTASFSIDPGQVVAGKQYAIEIIDDTGAQQPNYSNGFIINGATGSPTSSGSSSGTATITGSSSSSGTASSTGSSSSGSNSASATRSNSSSSRSSSPTASASETSAPNSANKITGAQGGLFAFMAAVIAIL